MSGIAMNLRRFRLAPFPGEERGPDMEITGALGRRANRFSIRCALLGDLSELAIPASGTLPARRDRLWEETCLEFFLGADDSERYWEFNLSPAGSWNVYRFASYREGMREEPAFASLPFRVRAEPKALRFSLELDLGKIIRADKGLEAAVSAVIKTAEGETTYWASAHPGPRPDFHRRDGFTLRFAAR